ncbi:CRISPR-associated endonuclease Cas2 [Paracoccaceae bacterium]|nr:CRISPR-associated endonuclease Cas2 [Paracoccaceae bacterium]
MGEAAFLSGYRLLWMLVMFDLPTDTKLQRSQASKFREFLLDEGFERAQYSIYARFCNGKEAFEARIGRIKASLPSWGDVQILQFTDKQYENIIRFNNQGRKPVKKNPTQLVLF